MGNAYEHTRKGEKGKRKKKRGGKRGGKEEEEKPLFVVPVRYNSAHSIERAAGASKKWRKNSFVFNLSFCSAHLTTKEKKSFDDV